MFPAQCELKGMTLWIGSECRTHSDQTNVNPYARLHGRSTGDQPRTQGFFSILLHHQSKNGSDVNAYFHGFQKSTLLNGGD